MNDDLSGDIQTIGTAAVGGTAEGNIETARDRDWFEVDLVAGRTYTIDLKGSPTGDGTLSDPRLYGIHDAAGNLIARTTNDDWGGTYNSQVTFTATASGTHYIAAGAFGSNQGTYTVEVTDKSAADDTRAGATDLGDITALQGPRFPWGTVDGDADGVDYYRFTLAAAKRVGLGLRQQDADADLFLEDANGTVLYSSTVSGTDNERIAETLLAGTYYVRVESQEAGLNAHVVRYGVSAPDPDAVAALQQQSGTAVNEAPAFEEQGYTFALAENADGGTNRVSLGTVAATDPEGATLAYSLVGGNESGSFDIDAASGELFYTGSGEDFESATTRFTLTVRASDGSEAADTTVTVNVTDVNEPPAFAEASYAFDLAENVDGSTNRVSLGTVAAADPEGTTLAYSLVGDSGSFEIDATSGELFYKGSGEDFESGTTRFTLTVRASDGSGITDTTVTVNVTDVNETPAFGQQGYTFALAENVDGSTNRVSLGTVAAADPEGTTLAYSLVGDSGSFEIDATSGELFYKGSGEDFESGTTQFTLAVRASDGSETADTIVTVNVTDVDEAPAIRVADAEATEGDDTEMVFRVTLESASSGTVTVNYATADGTATAGEDYTATSGTLTFAPGETEKTVSVAIIDDTVEDSGETFTLVLSEPSGGSLADTEATGTIFNTDPPPARTSVSEPAGEDLPADTTTTGAVEVGGAATGDIGTSGDRDWFAVDLVQGLTYIIDLRGSTTDLHGMPAGGTLYDPNLYGIHDAAGNRIAGTTNDDGGIRLNSRVTFTPTESGTHYIAAGASSARNSRGDQGTYTVEVTEQPPAIRVANAQATEGDDSEIVFRVTLERASSGTVTVNYATADGTATAGADYTATSGTLTFAPGETEKSVAVTILDDTVEDSGERFRLVLSDPSGARLGDAKATGAIFDTETRTSVSELDNYDLPAGATTPGAVAVGGTATGNIGRDGDRDWFAVELVAGTVYRIDLKGRSTNDGTQGDPYLRGIYDAEGDLLPDTLNNNHGTGSNARVYFTAPETGTHYIAAGAGRNSQGTYTLAVTELETDDPAGDLSTHASVAVDGSTDGMIAWANDRDWFSVQLDADTLYRIELKGGWGGGRLSDPHLFGIFDSNGSAVAGAVPDIQWRYTPRLFFTPTEAGEYYISAGTDHPGGRHSPESGTYTLSVTEMDFDDFSADTMTMGSVAVGDSVEGTVETPYDRDWFAVQLTAGTSYRIDLKGYDTGNGTTWNTFLAGIHDSNGDLIPGTTDDDGGFWQEAQVSFTPTDTGTYYIAAGAAGIFSGAADTFFSAYGAFTGSYTLFVEEVM